MFKLLLATITIYSCYLTYYTYKSTKNFTRHNKETNTNEKTNAFDYWFDTDKMKDAAKQQEEVKSQEIYKFVSKSFEPTISQDEYNTEKNKSVTELQNLCDQANRVAKACNDNLSGVLKKSQYNPEVSDIASTDLKALDIMPEMTWGNNAMSSDKFNKDIRKAVEENYTEVDKSLGEYYSGMLSLIDANNTHLTHYADSFIDILGMDATTRYWNAILMLGDIALNSLKASLDSGLKQEVTTCFRPQDQDWDPGKFTFKDFTDLTDLTNGLVGSNQFILSQLPDHQLERTLGTIRSVI